MRMLPAAAVLLLATVSARAETCDELVAKVERAADAQVGTRSDDYATFTAREGVTLTLSCGERHTSSVGAQHRGGEPPEAYYETFGQAGHAVTGIEADVLRDAARRARADAARLRHSNVEAGGALVTCSLGKAEAGTLTMCAVIEHSNRS